MRSTKTAPPTLVAALLLAWVPSSWAAPPVAGLPPIVAHKASYAVTSGDAPGSTSMTVSRYGGDCTGTAESVVAHAGTHGPDVASLTYESADHSLLRFATTIDVAGKSSDALSGTARRDDQGIAVSLHDAGRRPGADPVLFPGPVVFPDDFDRMVLEAALDGRRPLVSARVFDGSLESHASPRTVTAAIFPMPPGSRPPASAGGMLVGLRSFRILVSSFKDDAADALPETTADMVEYEDGVVTRIVQSTGGVETTLTLDSLETTPPQACHARTP